MSQFHSEDVLALGKSGLLQKQYEAVRDASPNGLLRLRDLRAARRDSGAPVLGATLTEGEWASVLETVGCADEEWPVNAELFARVYLEVQLLRATDGGGCEHQLRQGGSYLEALGKAAVVRLLKAIGEAILYERYINCYLADDPVLKDVLPISMGENDLFDISKNGILFCKLINWTVPGTVDERVLNTNRMLSLQERLKNNMLCLRSCISIGCNISNISIDDLAEGRPYVVLDFLSQIMKIKKLTSDVNLKTTPQLTQSEVNIQREERFFRLWINSLGISICVDDLFEDLKDGWILLKVFDRISPGCVDWSLAHCQPLKQPSEIDENCIEILRVANGFKFPLPKNSGKYIAQGNRKMILNVLWQLKRHSILEKMKKLGLHSREEEIVENDILVCANKMVGKSSMIRSFQDKNLSSGSFFLSLLSAMGPHIVNWSHASDGKNEQDKKLNALYIISVTRSLGCPIFLLPEDILDVNPKMMLSLTASILSRHLEKQASHSLDNEIENSSNQGDSNLLSSKGCDFILEPVGHGRKKFILPREAYDPLLTYQKEAMHWFWRLYCEGNGGILADDMGLGKTRQVAVFLLGLFHSHLIHRALIVVPPTLLKQWEKELLDQGLTVNIRQYYGGPTERYAALHQIIEEGGVLLTTYDLIRSDHPQIGGDSTSLWNYMIIDEGHIVKNSSTESFKALVRIPCKNRIVVSGTPVQNCVEELWTLFKFCHPKLLPGLKTFKRDYSSFMSKGNYKDSTDKEALVASKVAKELRNMIEPYILRREKEKLLQSGALGNVRLGNKTEIVVWLKMTPLQISLYEKQMSLYQSLRKKLTSDRKKASITFITARLLQKISNHPLHIQKAGKEEESETESESTDENEVLDEMSLMDDMVSHLKHLVQVDDTVTEFTSSCKLKFIIELLDKLLEPESGHRVLIFSQTRQMLDAIQNVLSSMRYNFLRIDGTTKVKDRSSIVECFKKDSGPPILLLSSHVGGLGLNLTAADRVIIADPSWNPSVDAQSVDRVYRLGQEKHVYIYRLIAACTIEEKIYEEQVSKTSIFKATSEERDFKRFVLRKRKNCFLTLPKKGWSVSQVQRRFEQECQDYIWDQELNEHTSYLKGKDILGVSIHSLLFKETMPLPTKIVESGDRKSFSTAMLFKETMPLPTNIVESGDIKSFSTATSYRRKSSSDTIENAEHLARHPKDMGSSKDSIHSVLFKETMPLPTNIVESGNIESFSTATSYRRKSSSDTIENAEHRARECLESLNADIEKGNERISALRCELDLIRSMDGSQDRVREMRELIAEGEDLIERLLLAKKHVLKCFASTLESGSV